MRGTLVAYSPAHQIAWLGSARCAVSRQNLLNYISANKEIEIINHVAMSSIRVSNGSSYVDVLRKTLEKNISCIAVVDEYNKLCGIVDRDRLASALVLSVALSVQGKDVEIMPAAT